MDKPADENVAIEPEKTLDPEVTDADAILNDPPPQDHNFVAEQVEVDTTSHADQLTSQPAMSELMTNRQVQLKILRNRQPQ